LEGTALSEWGIRFGEDGGEVCGGQLQGGGDDSKTGIIVGLSRESITELHMHPLVGYG
jgi:hypothetical protein